MWICFFANYLFIIKLNVTTSNMPLLTNLFINNCQLPACLYIIKRQIKKETVKKFPMNI